MVLKIGSRKSDLARAQAYQVGSLLEQKNPGLKVEYVLSSSLGDRNQDLSLSASEDKGLFTQDLIQSLEQGEVDLVVHSWKDLPVEERDSTQVVATLEREDPRDVLLVKKSFLAQKDQARFRVLSSSPRRIYNLQSCLTELLPFAPTKVDFLPIRGNVPTRMRKLLAGEGDALVVAKAALDRLLSTPFADIRGAQEEVRTLLQDCQWMVLPLSLNPAAAAQGALALEVLRQRKDLIDLCAQVNCTKTYALVEKERCILQSYGGGCHQKIGVTLKPSSLGVIEHLRGQTEQGEILDRRKPLDEVFSGSPPQSLAEVWPAQMKDVSFFH